MRFEVNHSGRGGFIFCVNGKKEYKLGITNENPFGYFGIRFTGIKKSEKELIKKELRPWLDNTNRENWFFE